MFGLSMLVVYVDSRRCYGAPFNSTTPYFVLTSALHCLLILAWWAPILVYAADAGAEQRGLLLNRLSLRDRTRLLRPSHLAITFGLAISTVGIFVDTPRLLPLSFAIAGLSFSLMIIEHPLTPIWKLASWCGLILGIYLAVRFVQSPFWLSRSKDAKMPGYDCLFGVLSMVSAAAAFYLHSEKMNWGEDDYAPK